MTTLYEETNGFSHPLNQSEIYVTSDSSFWTAMRSKEIYPFKVLLTEQSVQVFYELKLVSEYISEVSSGSTELDELAAHGSIVLWKAVIGLMKMLSRYDIDLELSSDPGEVTYAYTTDQYLVWVLSFREIYPSRVVPRGRDTSFEFGKEKIKELKDFLFLPYKGNMKSFSSMRNVWRQAKTFRQISQ